MSCFSTIDYCGDDTLLAEALSSLLAKTFAEIGVELECLHSLLLFLCYSKLVAQNRAVPNFPSHPRG